MHWHYDVTSAEPILRDLVVGGTSDILEGAPMGHEGAVTTALNRFALQNADADVLDCIIAVSNEFYDYSAHASGYMRNGSNAATEYTNTADYTVAPKFSSSARQVSGIAPS